MCTAVLSPRFDALRLPRLTRHRDRDPLHLEDSFGPKPQAPNPKFVCNRNPRSNLQDARPTTPWRTGLVLNPHTLP